PIGDLCKKEGIPVLSLKSGAEAESTVVRAPVDVPSDAPAYAMFTSGTTGAPKGVVVPHRGILRLVVDPDCIEIRKDDAFLLLSPLTFDASTFEIWGALLNGATLAIYTEPTFDPNALAKTIREHRVTTVWLTAGLFHLLIRRSIDLFEGVKT